MSRNGSVGQVAMKKITARKMKNKASLINFMMAPPIERQITETDVYGQAFWRAG